MSKSKTFPAAFWTDDTAPELADILTPHGIDAAGFTQWLGELLGDYRVSMAWQQGMPPREDELQMMAALNPAFDALRAALGTEGLPPRIDMHAGIAALALGIDWSAMRKRLRADLALAQSVLRTATAAARAGAETRGRKPATARAALLRAVVDRLRETPMSANAARGVAEQIMIRCRIAVPAAQDGGFDTRAIQRAAQVRRQK